MVTLRVGPHRTALRARVLAATIAVAITALGAGCELANVSVATPRPRVIVHAMLNPDAAEQVILLESSLTGRVAIDDTVRFDPLDPVRTAGGEPISNADVRLLDARDTVGVRAVETRVSGRGTGRYTVSRAALAVLPGARYRLRIRTADGVVVTGETLVPSAPSGWVYGAGELPVRATLSRSTDTLRVSWPPVPDARTYVIRIETPDGPWFLFSDSTQFSLAGSLRNFFAGGLPSVWYPGFVQSLVVTAVDKNSFDYNRSGNDPFGGSGLISSVQGGLGVFGSSRSLLRRDVSVRDVDRAPIDATWLGTVGTTVVDMDLWLETAGPTISSVSGRVRTSSNRYVVGTLQGDNIRLITLAGISRRDTVSALVGRLLGDSIVGTYNARFSTSGPTVFRKRPRAAPPVP
jgi:hypothetical protein